MKLTVDFERGDHGKALELTEYLLDSLSQEVSKYELVPSEDEVFRVSLENKVVFDSNKQAYRKKRIEQDLREEINELSDS